MAYTSEQTSTPSALSKWVESLYDRIFCQPNDEFSASAFDELVAPSFTARINHDQFSRQEFCEVIQKFRLHNVTSFPSTKEIQTWEAPDGSGAGCVSQLLRVHDTNKETGVTTKGFTLLVANVKVVDGQKMLFEITEVLKVPG